MNDYVLYILMRNDLPSMNVGRAAAQASHASNAFIHSFGKRNDVKKWQKQTSQGFGTAIVLSADKKTIQFTIDNINKCKDCPISWVTDPEYGMPVTKEIWEHISIELQSAQPVVKEDGMVVWFRKEDTCAYIFGSKEDLLPFLGELPLWPN